MGEAGWVMVGMESGVTMAVRVSMKVGVGMCLQLRVRTDPIMRVLVRVEVWVVVDKKGCSNKEQ